MGSCHILPESALLPEAQLESAAQLLKAMAHPTRLRLLCAVAKQSLTVQDLVAYTGLGQGNVSQHLAILRQEGVLTANRQGNRVFYRITDNYVLSMLELLRNHLCPESSLQQNP